MTTESYEQLKARLGTNVKYFRGLKNLTQIELSSRTGYTINYLSLLENGHRGISLEGLAKLANALEVEPGKLIGDLLEES